MVGVLKISWKNIITNTEVLRRVKDKRGIFNKEKTKLFRACASSVYGC